jgi:hypothetical protein
MKRSTRSSRSPSVWRRECTDAFAAACEMPHPAQAIGDMRRVTQSPRRQWRSGLVGFQGRAPSQCLG